MRFLAALFLVLPAFTAAAPATLNLDGFHNAGPEPSPLLILGTFHFKDAGRDGYKPTVDIDVLSETRQQEVEEVVHALAAFKPGKIALEARGERAGTLQQEYRRYLDGEFVLGANEIYQLGFRLAKRLGHETLYFVDAVGRRYDGLGERDVAVEACKQKLESGWNARYTALYRGDDSAKAARSLRETFLYMNSEARLLAGHGHYLVGGFHAGCGDNYHGADNLTGWWYNRNLRIFANLGRIRSPGESMLLIIGAGHVPILRHAAQASPEFRLVDVENVLLE